MPPTVPYNKIYLDNLPNDPSFGDASNTSIKIVDVCYNFGIPSVRTFQIDLSRNFHNLHSQYKFLPKDREILKIEPINNGNNGNNWKIIGDNPLSVNLKPIAAKISGVKSKNKELITLNVSGDYNLSHTDFSNIQGYYTSSITVSNGNIGWTETLKNLRGSHVVPKPLTHNHYCDYGSFIRSNGQNGQINQPRLNLDYLPNSITICEISNISLLGSNLGGIIAREYTDHTTLIQDHTLLYIDGKFQTNAQRPYPNTYHFSWNGHSSIHHFSAGTTSYGTDGQSSTSPNNPQYKWIGFKLNDGILLPNRKGKLLNIETLFDANPAGAASVPSFTIYDILDHFHENIINDLDSRSSDNVIGFVQQEYMINDEVYIRIGNIKLDLVGGSEWYTKDSSGINFSFFDDASKQYGARNSSNYKQLIFPKAADNEIGTPSSTIYLYIGVKNTFS